MKNEKVLCIETAILKSAFGLSEQFMKIEIDNLNKLEFKYLNRQIAERDFTVKQLIPYALVQNPEGQLLCYRRHGSEKRLHNIMSAGFGGHVNEGDSGSNLISTLTNGLKREILEELGLQIPDNQINMLGLINEDESEVGFCHIGIVFSIALKNEQKPTFSDEIGDAMWLPINELQLENFELWSELALQLLKTWQES